MWREARGSALAELKSCGHEVTLIRCTSSRRDTWPCWRSLVCVFSRDGFCRRLEHEQECRRFINSAPAHIISLSVVVREGCEALHGSEGKFHFIASYLCYVTNITVNINMKKCGCAVAVIRVSWCIAASWARPVFLCLCSLTDVEPGLIQHQRWTKVPRSPELSDTQKKPTSGVILCWTKLLWMRKRRTESRTDLVLSAFPGNDVRSSQSPSGGRLQYRSLTDMMFSFAGVFISGEDGSACAWSSLPSFLETVLCSLGSQQNHHVSFTSK